MDQNTKDILETVNFIKERMLTKDDVREIVREELEPVKSKVDGINQRLDTEAIQRTDLKVPRRVHDLEEEVFGEGGSKHPKHVPL